MISVTTAILTAAGKPGWALALTGPLLPLVVAGHLLLIPRLGAVGAALATTLVAGLGALAAQLAVYRLWQVLPSAATLGRSVLVCGLAYALAVFWPAPGPFLLVKLSTMGCAIPLALWLLGEFSPDETARVRSILCRKRIPLQNSREAA
ncbi:MAG: hypothetical protein EXS64_10560 [Candidatus Latescibacteria bacterium]|nr:hypothetical protein [Candidatus Latescibacterota bacterium]